VHVCRTHGENTDDLVHELVQVRVHESRHLPSSDVLRTMSPPRMSQERCAADAASDARSERACRTVLAICVQQRLIVPGRVRAMVVERRNLPRRRLILETLGDLEGGAQSLPEQDFLRSLRRAGLPLPSRQRAVRRPDGRYVLDCDYDEWMVTVEINGAHHLDVQQREYDDVRRTRLAIGGRLVVDLGSWIVRHDPDLAVLLTADALLARGWRPEHDLRASLIGMAGHHPTFSWTSTAA
jgi:very-short-patch-repair endonuclease